MIQRGFTLLKSRHASPLTVSPVADGLFTRDSVFHPLPELPIRPLEEIFRAHILKLLVGLELLPADRVRLLHPWKHSGFNVHHGESVPPENKALLEQLTQ